MIWTWKKTSFLYCFVLLCLFSLEGGIFAPKVAIQKKTKVIMINLIEVALDILIQNNVVTLRLSEDTEV